MDCFEEIPCVVRACLKRESSQCPVYRSSEEKAVQARLENDNEDEICLIGLEKRSESRFRVVWFLERNGDKLEEESNQAEKTVQEKSVK